MFIVVLPLIWAVSSAITTSGVKSKFANLGIIAGRTKGEICKAVGPSNSISTLVNGQQILQWTIPGYHIALIFTDEICDGVSHEHSA